MSKKQAFHAHQDSQRAKPTAGKWRWLLPPVLSVLVALTVWWGMPKPSIPTIYQSVKPVVAQTSHSPTGQTQPLQGVPSGPLAVPSTSGSTGPSSALTPPSSAGSSIPSSNKTLVALGDSITFGYRLPGATATSPSPDAYPYLIGKKLHYQVTDLGVTGWTSSDLLNALQTNHRYQIALRKANLVTLDIGSNDLLHTSYDLIAALQQNLPPKDDVLTDSRYQAALTQYSANMAQILTVIHQQTKAPIVLLNLYDPFPDGSSIHDIGEQLIAAANQVIWQMAAQSAVPVVNVYDTINHHQDTLVRLDSLDIHPTIAGQQALAADVLQVLQHPLQAQPVYYAVAKAGLLIRSKPQLGPNAMHWLEAGTGVLVTGRQGDWLQVVTPSGQSGFVQQNLVNVVLRPWNDVSFTNYSTSLQTGVIRDEPSGKSADVFVWNGVVYAPVQYLASLASATVSVNSDTLQVDVETPAHSGLIQTGWLSPPPSSSSPPPSPKVSVQLEPSGPYGFIQFGTKGFMVSVDGEDVNLHGQVVEHQGQIAVPVQGFWQALGGTVTLDANGLPRLSVAGS